MKIEKRFMSDKKTRNGAAAFPTATVSRLRKAGWTPKRVVATSLYEHAYDSEQIRFLPKTKQFLRQFGGLIIPYLTKSRQEDVLEFLADRAVQGLGGSGIEVFEELIGTVPLCPIGHYLFGTCILFMDCQGRVFGGSDETVTFVGESGEEAIGNILTGVEGEVLEPKTT
ncbi:MAG TPA: SUKH-3 domain-containing protein [Pirellulales bacterium]|nr:SUKH-3 domain-containing protein [Pirellulales bacterium]